MNETTESASASETKTNEEGTQVKGKDFIFLDAPAIEFPGDAPLKNTDKRELYSILDELFQDGGGGGDDDWYPPNWWIPVPEPNEYDIYVLILIQNNNGTFGVQVVDANSVTNKGSLFCDWGDGTTETVIDTSQIMHTYKQAGQYLVHFIGNVDKCFWRAVYPAYNRPMQVAKSGSKILICANEFDSIDLYRYLASNNYYLKYFETKNENCIPINGFFSNCFALEKISCPKKIPKVGNQLFYNCKSLKSLDVSRVEEILQEGFRNCGLAGQMNMPLCTHISDYAFCENYNLTAINATNCVSVGNNAFASCYKLFESNFAEDCIMGTNSFYNCYSLYPRFDGTVNY